MMKRLLVVLMVLSLIVFGCKEQKITDFKSCVEAGNPAMESYPRQCRAGDIIFVEGVEPVESEAHICSAEELAAEICTMEYAPVCGNDGATYGNGCAACASKKITSYALGECPTVIGGDKDEHGCLGPAGYSWCEAKQECLRVWEEDCPAAGTSEDEMKARDAAFTYLNAVEEFGSSPKILRVLGKGCIGCYEIELSFNTNTEPIKRAMATLTLVDWKVTDQNIRQGTAMSAENCVEESGTVMKQEICSAGILGEIENSDNICCG